MPEEEETEADFYVEGSEERAVEEDGMTPIEAGFSMGYKDSEKDFREQEEETEE